MMARIRVEVPIDQAKQQETATDAPQASSFFNRKNILTAVIIALAIGVISAVASLLMQNNKLENQVNKLSGSQTISQDQQYQENVSKTIEVPVGITPQIKSPTQDELARLAKDNPIYKDTRSGDVFLIYTNTDKSLFVVIYRPSTDKVILATLGSAPASEQTKR